MRLRKARLALNLTETECANILEMTEGQYHLIEAGSAPLTQGQAVSLALHARIALHYLFVGDGPFGLEPKHTYQDLLC